MLCFIVLFLSEFSLFKIGVCRSRLEGALPNRLHPTASTPTSSGSSMAVPSMPISPVCSPFLPPSGAVKARGEIFLDRICGAGGVKAAAGRGGRAK